jgi:hypothetical protein
MSSASCLVCVVSVNGRLAMALVSKPFCFCNVSICSPITFMHFYSAFACDTAVAPVLATFSSAVRRVAYSFWSALNLASSSIYPLHWFLKRSVALKWSAHVDSRLVNLS